MRRAVFVAASLAAAALAPDAGAGSARRARVLMGTTCTVEVEAPSDDVAAAAALAALDEIERVEAVHSTWRPDAEMALANGAARTGTATLSRELAEDLHFALQQARRTEGAFDPAIGALVDAWDLRGAGRVPGAAELDAARAASGLRRVRLDVADRRLAFDSPLTWIDTGGFAKGLALDRAAEAARRAGAVAGLLDFGGQILVVGADRGDWRIAVADPRDRERPALELALRDGSASTSAQSERFVVAEGRRLGHVLDPRTGRPVELAGSATVVAATGAEADALSTALLVMGPRRGLRFAREQRLCAGFLVPGRGLSGERLVLRATPSFLALVRGAAPGVPVRGEFSHLRSSRR